MNNNIFKQLISFLKEKQTIIATTLIVLALISFATSYCKNRQNILVPYFNSNYSKVAVNVEFNKNIDNTLVLKTGSNKHARLIPTRKYKYSLGAQNNSAITEEPLKSLEIVFLTKDKQVILDNLSNISIFIGKDFWTFDKNQVLKFSQKSDKIGNSDVTVLTLPQDVSKTKNAKYVNYNGIQNEISIFLLSIFYCYKFYIIPWLLLIFGIFALKENPLAKYRFLPIIVIFLVGLLVRLNMRAENAFWWDEHYVLSFTGNPNSPWIHVFGDPGNPPLFSLLAKIWFCFGDTSIEWARLLPVIFSSLGLLTLYLLLKDRINKSFAILATFFATFSAYLISYSQEFRSYSVSVFLAPLVAYFLFKTLEEKNSNKNLLGFFITSALLINNHFFGCVVALFNFFYGIYYYIKNSIRDNRFLNFVLVNIIVVLTFMPFAIMTFIDKALLDPNYNNWIAKISITRLQLIILANFGSLYVFFGLILLCVIFFISINLPTKFKLFEDSDKKAIDFISYTIFLVTFVYLFTFIFSIKRSVLVPYYYIIVFPFMITLMCYFAYLKWKKKFINFVMSILLVYSFGNLTYHNGWKINRSYDYLSHIASTQADLHPDYTVLALIDPIQYANIYPKFQNLVWAGNYNGADEHEPKFVQFMEDMKLNNKFYNNNMKVIICIMFKELNWIDQNTVLRGKIHQNIEHFAIPNYHNDIIKITIEPQNK